MIAVVRIRGTRKLKPKIRKTLEMLNLFKPNHCVVVPETPQYLGMLSVVKDYVTFGKIDSDMLFKLLYKKGKKGSRWVRELMEKEKLEEAARDIFDGKKKIQDIVDPVFCLHPPRKGYKNIKLSYPAGDLGARDDIATLLNRMI
ncbi:MAG: 50S ribosomal protein L30 [Candidatus Bilamarchaeaceae archaeon]